MILGLLLAAASLRFSPPPAVCPVPGSAGQCAVFSFDWPAAKVSRYTLVVQEDRVARYWEGDGASDETLKAKQQLSVSAVTLGKIFEARPDVRGDCETHEKHLAQTGKKKLQFFYGDEESGCSFNYSDNERLNAVAALFQKMAETIQAGDRLRQKKRFDHLGLDAELDSLLAAAKDGRAIELQNIASVLSSIAEDDELMSPSRRKAQLLLQMSEGKNRTP